MERFDEFDERIIFGEYTQVFWAYALNGLIERALEGLNPILILGVNELEDAFLAYCVTALGDYSREMGFAVEFVVADSAIKLVAFHYKQNGAKKFE